MISSHSYFSPMSRLVRHRTHKYASHLLISQWVATQYIQRFRFCAIVPVPPLRQFIISSFIIIINDSLNIASRFSRYTFYTFFRCLFITSRFAITRNPFTTRSSQQIRLSAVSIAPPVCFLFLFVPFSSPPTQISPQGKALFPHHHLTSRVTTAC